MRARGVKERGRVAHAPFTSGEDEFGPSVDGKAARNVGFSY